MHVCDKRNSNIGARRSSVGRAMVTGAMIGAVSFVLGAPQFVVAQETSDGPAVAASQSSLPKAETLFEKHVEAIGGREKIKSHSSHTTKATFVIPGAGVETEMLIKAAAPNLFVMSVDIPGMGQVRQGYNGKVAWSIDPMQGPSVLSGEELEQMKLQADFYSDLNYKDHYSKMETVDKVQFDGRACYKVHVTGAGDMESDLYFDVETGLLRGMEAETDTQMGKMTTTTRLTEYKEFDGVKQPTKTIVVVFGQERQLKLESIEYNSVSDKDFELPEEIKTMVSDKDDKNAADENDKGGETGGDDGG